MFYGVHGHVVYASRWNVGTVGGSGVLSVRRIVVGGGIGYFGPRRLAGWSERWSSYLDFYLKFAGGYFRFQF